MRAFCASSFLLVWAITTQGQGTVLFRNFDAATGFSAPVFHYDAVTRLSGTDYVVELLAGPSLLNLSIIATTNLLSGAQAGYFDGGVKSIPEVPSGSNAFIQIRVWTASSGSFAAAQAAGVVDAWAESQVFQVTLGGQASPAILTPLSALWLDNALDSPPVPLYVNFKRVDSTALVSWVYYLEVSTNLVQWTNFGPPPQIFPLSQTFPLTQGPIFFRSKLWPNP